MIGCDCTLFLHKHMELTNCVQLVLLMTVGLVPQGMFGK